MTLEELANGPPLDAAIIGGGINGCAIARELAGRGLRVALFEQDDFGFGTTWRSTKLIHGGLRYLEHGDVRLVFESLKERAWLLRTRPHLVRPLRFLLPLVEWSRRPAWQWRAGLTAYDLLALRGGLPRHHRLDANATRALAPAVAPLEGSLTFYDAIAVAPERLALELALEARTFGAAIFNHAAVTGIETGAGQVRAVRAASGETTVSIPARHVINAAGPWVDAVNACAGTPPEPLLGVTRGTHIVLDVPGNPLGVSLLSTARSDGRVFFAIPRDGLLLIGTTDDRFDEAPGDVRPTHDDVGYLLQEARTLLPGADITPEHIRYAYAGLRPLQRVSGGPEAAISRRHAVIDHEESGGPAGLLSVIGGKLSTFRPLADDVAKTVGAEGHAPSPRPPGDSWSRAPERFRIYGNEAVALSKSGDVLCEHAGITTGEVEHAVRREEAGTLSDILMRRSGLAWTATRGLCCHEVIAGAAAGALGWDADERARQVNAFERDVRFHLPSVEELVE
jgi:glycerol-3-phosphate dehydrogenase